MGTKILVILKPEEVPRRCRTLKNDNRKQNYNGNNVGVKATSGGKQNNNKPSLQCTFCFRKGDAEKDCYQKQKNRNPTQKSSAGALQNTDPLSTLELPLEVAKTAWQPQLQALQQQVQYLQQKIDQNESRSSQNAAMNLQIFQPCCINGQDQVITLQCRHNIEILHMACKNNTEQPFSKNMPTVKISNIWKTDKCT